MVCELNNFISGNHYLLSYSYKNTIMDKVTVLMSTYNGDLYLNDQINSILNQSNVKVDLLVRDDGSTDSTLNLLKKYQDEGKLKFFTGENLGPARSFLQLLSCTQESDYYAFSDQDDYWLPDKLSSAVGLMQGFKDRPCLYFCQTKLVDKNLNPIEQIIIRPRLTFGEALVYQFVGGCTMVLNAKMRDVVNSYIPSYLYMHDVWIYDIAMAIGAKVLFDPIPHILYRQHGNNVVGQGKTNIKTKWERRIKRIIINKEHPRYRIANEIKNGYWQGMGTDNKAILKKFIGGHESLATRLSMILDRNYMCSNHRVYRDFQISLLLNTY